VTTTPRLSLGHPPRSHGPPPTSAHRRPSATARGRWARVGRGFEERIASSPEGGIVRRLTGIPRNRDAGAGAGSLAPAPPRRRRGRCVPAFSWFDVPHGLPHESRSKRLAERRELAGCAFGGSLVQQPSPVLSGGANFGCTHPIGGTARIFSASSSGPGRQNTPRTQRKVQWRGGGRGLREARPPFPQGPSLLFVPRWDGFYVRICVLWPFVFVAVISPTSRW